MLYIRRHAKEWRLDPEKIAVSGFSAGGHLACSLGTMCNDPAVTGLLGVTPQEIAPNAMVLGYPVIAADPAIAHVWSIKNVSGVEDTSSPDYLKFGLEHKVNEFTPPTYLWHTADDNCVPCKTVWCLRRRWLSTALCTSCTFSHTGRTAWPLAI